MPTVEKQDLLAAVKAHAFELELERVVSSGPRRAALERRIEDTAQLLRWLSPILELQRSLPEDALRIIASGEKEDRAPDLV